MMLREQHLMHIFLCFLFLVTLTQSIFPQNFDRVIELKNPTRMYGKDILDLQNRLLSLGFSEIGEADGYYGPLTEKVIKDIQKFSGFEYDGKVNRILWNFIFDYKNSLFLQNINIVLKYDIKKLEKTNIVSRFFWGERSNPEVYFSLIDKKVKILVQDTFYSASGLYIVTAFFVDDNYYFFEYKEGHYEEIDTINGKMYLVENSNLFEIVNGNLLSVSKENWVAQNSYEAINDALKNYNK